MKKGKLYDKINEKRDNEPYLSEVEWRWKSRWTKEESDRGNHEGRQV